MLQAVFFHSGPGIAWSSRSDAQDYMMIIIETTPFRTGPGWFPRFPLGALIPLIWRRNGSQTGENDRCGRISRRLGRRRRPADPWRRLGEFAEVTAATTSPPS